MASRASGPGEHAQPDAEGDGELRLIGESGRTVAENIARIALGKVSVSELGKGYGLARDGTLRLSIDAESFDAVEKILKP
jgi:hypothetical protein